jgi:hypothetical protein
VRSGESVCDRDAEPCSGRYLDHWPLDHHRSSRRAHCRITLCSPQGRESKREKVADLPRRLNKLDLLGPDATALHRHLLARSALVAEVSLLAQLLARHLWLRRLAILAQVTVTTTLASHTDTFLATSGERMSLVPTLALRLNHLMRRVLVALGAVTIHLLRNFHNVARTMKCL